MPLFADTVIRNAKVATMDEQSPFCEAVAVREGRIVATGTAAEVEPFTGPSTEVLDAGGRTMLPGFINSHCHADVYGASP